jgi:DNA-binding NarL/FixJ family response regulator
VTRHRVFLADDHDLVIESLATTLSREADLEVVGRASDGLTALREIARVRPDVALLDQGMPKRSGTDVVRALARSGQPIRALLVTSIDDDAVVLEARDAGCQGVVRKTAPLAVLLEAIRTVARGGVFVDPGAPTRARTRLGSLPIASRRDNPLTPREREILQRVAAGASNAEIARELSSSEGTVKNHVSSILRKLDARDQTQAVLAALRDGWI